MGYEFNKLKQGRNPTSAFIPDNPHISVKLSFGAPAHNEPSKVIQTCTKTRIFEGGRFMSEETEFKPAKSIQAFMPVGGGIQVKLRPMGPPAVLGKPFLGPSIMMDRKPLQLPDPRPLRAETPQMFELDPEPTQMLPPPPAPKIEDPQVQVSVERVVFLERLEKLMGDGSKMKELEAENRALIRAIGRLQEELDVLKGKVTS